MASHIFEFFGYRVSDKSEIAHKAVVAERCPILQDTCEKTFNDGTISGVCSIKPITSKAVICCPIRLYAENYQILKAIGKQAFQEDLPLITGKDAVAFAQNNAQSCIAVFGKKWGRNLDCRKN